MARGQQTLDANHRIALGRAIRAKRGPRAVSTLAPAAGIADVTWRKYESGESSPSLACLLAVAHAVGCKASQLCKVLD